MTYFTGGVVTVESVFILIVSGVVIFVVIVSVVVGGTVFCVLPTAVESRLLVDIVDSLVPQLTANIPMPIAANKNFFILFHFGGVIGKKSIIIPNKVYKL